ncbi:MAG: HD-GYP domain-containing protein [Agathobacter sp.]|nr:HD-GYP domain-containing protein [Agathobacter sp.]
MIKKLAPKELEIDMIIAEAIITPSGQTLAPAGTVLSKPLINKVKLYNVPFVLIRDSELASPVSAPPTPVTETLIDENKKPTTHAEEIQSASVKIANSTEFKGFQLDYFLFIEHLKNVFTQIISTPNYKADTNELITKLSPLYISRNTIIELFDMIHQMHSINDSVYAHCVNVALISRMIGRWLRLEQQDLNVLTCCGLFHDIGKLAIPDEILNKPDKLTAEEFSIVKSHPTQGYQMLTNQDLDIRIKQSVLLHHERYDGSGYPSGLSGQQLPDFSMIVAIADVYDAMTAARSYREPLCAFQVIENFERDGYQKYNTKYIYVFLHQIATTYQNNRIMLNDGRIAKIVMLNQNRLSKPIIQFDNGECLDLSSCSDLYISKVL